MFKKKKVTIAGTDIEEVKRQNAQAEKAKFQSENQNFKEETASEIFSQDFSGMSVEKTQAGTNIQKVKEEIAEESSVFSNSQSSSSLGKTIAGIDIQKVKKEINEES